VLPQGPSADPELDEAVELVVLAFPPVDELPLPEPEQPVTAAIINKVAATLFRRFIVE